MENSPTQEKISFFLFINSKSGGGRGQKYLSVPNRKLTYQYAKSTICLHFIDLFDQELRNKGLNQIVKAINKIDRRGKGKVSVIVCGGDGTVLWVVSIIKQHGIDLNKISFCIIPIGTGNDFSRCLGWGGSPITFEGRDLDNLKNRLLEWLEADEKQFDVWHATVTTYEDGDIIQIRDKREVSTGLKQLKRGFCNYVGIGIDARICYNVELKRQKNKWLNLALYGCIGLCKYFQRIRSTRDAIQNFVVQENVEHQNKNEKINFSKEDPLIESKKGNIELQPGYGNLLALNSLRYMAGLRNVWNTSKLGIQTDKPPQFQSQNFDDGKIQFIGFKNELRLGLERICNFGARVAQGDGPFYIEFRRTQANQSTYIHIDGQAMRIKQLKQIIISRNRQVPNGKIKVLVRRQ